MTQELIERLEPCPFPHEIKRGPFIERDTEDFFFVRVSCGDCGCAGPFVSIIDNDGQAEETEAVRLWNTRDQSQSARIAELEGLLEPFANLADANMNDPLRKWLTVAHIQNASRLSLTKDSTSG